MAEDGLAGRGGGFAVVVGAEGGAVGAENVGPADVSGVVVRTGRAKERKRLRFSV